MTPEFLAGKVPEIVYKKAIECIPGTGNSKINTISVFKFSYL